MTLPLTERILRRVDVQADGCWLWTGAARHGRSGGYARLKVAGRMRPVHCVAYEAFVGPIPDGLVIDHLCRNTLCANPAHLEPVTIGENLLRGDTFQAKNARKTHCPKNHPYDDENTYHRATSRGPARGCRACAREATRQWRARRAPARCEVTVTELEERAVAALQEGAA
jgi:hypothetical protein